MLFSIQDVAAITTVGQEPSSPHHPMRKNERPADDVELSMQFSFFAGKERDSDQHHYTFSSAYILSCTFGLVQCHPSADQ